MYVHRGAALQKKRAIRLLILVVTAFAVLLLPIHIHLLVGLTVGFLEEKYQWYEVRAARNSYVINIYFINILIASLYYIYCTV